MADDLERRAIIAAHDAEHERDGERESCDLNEDDYPRLNKRERAIVEALRGDLDKLTERIERYQRLDVIHMKNQLRMTRTLDEALGLADADCDTCVPGCDEGAQGAEHLMHHLIERDAAREGAIERVRGLLDIAGWHVYQSRDTGEVYPASLVQDLMADIRRALDGTEAGHG